jgi:hypothetical protein
MATPSSGMNSSLAFMSLSNKYQRCQEKQGTNKRDIFKKSFSKGLVCNNRMRMDIKGCGWKKLFIPNQ